MNTVDYVYKRPFLLMEGGPLYRIEKRIGLIKSRELEVRRRAFLSVLVTWVPLLILSALQGKALGHSATMPFLKDIGVHARFLLAVPLLLTAENFLGPRIAEAAEHFVYSGLILPKDFQKFDNAVDRGLRLRDSVVAEIIIAIIAYAIPILTAFQSGIYASTWRMLEDGTGPSISWAGWWFFAFCGPFVQFLMLRWLWRLFLWFQFLNTMSKLDLALYPTHPDKSGGLEFVGQTQRFFGVLLFAYSTGVSGVLANQIVYFGASLKGYAISIAAYVILGVAIVVGPLIVFSGKLIKLKRQGLHQYGTLSTTYTGSFHNKWIRGEHDSNEPLLGTGDIQSLADLGNSYEFIVRMNALPINPRAILSLIVTSLLPLAPLLLTVMSPKEIIRLLLKVLV